ncbi:MAG: hypothetical protein Q9205_005326 [Flavoplaca limonia]
MSQPSPFTQATSSVKKQQSISSFFGKPSAPRPRTHQTPKATEESLFVEELDDTAVEPHGRKRRKLSDGSPSLTPISTNRRQKGSPSARTSQYAFGSPSRDTENHPDDDEMRATKEILHQQFVKKLGRPDSIAEIKRRNWVIGEAQAQDGGVEENEEGEEEGDNEEVVKPAPKIKTAAARKSKLTPMDKQILDIKRANLDTLLIIEVGYKFKFFGEDARTAAKELSIVCIPGKYRYDEHPSEAHMDRFASASIPVHRLHVHVKRLVGAGHKVGVVRQLETAALKAAGDNRNTPFVRKLTNVYTKGTYIDDIEGLEISAPSSGTPATGHLVCITEKNAHTDEKVRIGILAVQPATGDIVHDSFEDGFMRSEIETRLLHIAPCEILVVGELSKATEKLVQHLSGSGSKVFGEKVRVERVDKSKAVAAQAYSHVCNFYAGKLDESDNSPRILDSVLKLPEDVTICLSAMITHMAEYGLEDVFNLTKYFQSFSARSHMLLNGTTLTSLEIYQNQTDHSEKGSLFWTLDRTRTRFGRRLLRKWVGRPLLLRNELENRITAVQELAEHPAKADMMNSLLGQIRSDLEKSLIRIFYGRCTRPELLSTLQTMQRIANFRPHDTSDDTGFRSELIVNALSALPSIRDDVVGFLERINTEAAKNDDKYTFFREETDAITEHKLGIASTEYDLNSERTAAAAKVKKAKVEYVTVAGIEYLIEIENTQLKHVPASWSKISGTKKVSRFHTPEVVHLIRERDQHKEALAAACDVAYTALLTEISTKKYQSFRDCVQALATLDCLLSLAVVANQPNYVKPEFTDDTCVVVDQGRHPMVEQLLLDGYVPNQTDLGAGEDQTRALLITGPNMGGKSSYVRQIALIAIMGQIGSYVPAASAKLGMLDAVFTRMGAFDNMMAGESTFMVELSETSDIIKQATSRSLIILDELGRGTSTHDGVAIAEAVLDHIVREIKSLVLFITHYQNLSIVAKRFAEKQLKNVHMRFQESGENSQEITFLYEVGDGVAHRSYGLNVARLANLPESVLEMAAVKSKALEDKIKQKSLAHLSRALQFKEDVGAAEQLEMIVNGIEQL